MDHGDPKCLIRKIGLLAANRFRSSPPELDIIEIFEGNETGSQGIIRVVSVVSQTVCCIDDLRFQQRPPGLGPFRIGRASPAAVLHKRLPDLPRQIQTGEVWIAGFQEVNSSQSIEVVVEPAFSAQTFVQRPFAGMTEGRMSEMLRLAMASVRSSLRCNRLRDRPADLGNFQRVCEAGSVMVVDVSGENLGFSHELAERFGVDDAVAIALKNRAIGMIFFEVTPAPTRAAKHRIRSEPGIFKGEPVHSVTREKREVRYVGRVEALRGPPGERVEARVVGRVEALRGPPLGIRRASQSLDPPYIRPTLPHQPEIASAFDGASRGIAK